MRKFLSILFILSVCSCIVKKKTTYSKERKITVAGSNEDITKNTDKNTKETLTTELSQVDRIINTALTFSGTRYKFGGTNKKGMDCSGLLYVSFGEHDVPLPRVSHQIAEKGRRVKVKNVIKGDLLFFKTSKRGKKINHVGMVVSVEGNDIKFIHASTSRGVTVSSLREGYWNFAFIKATRVL